MNSFLSISWFTSFINWLIQKDKALFLFFNKQHTNTFFDWLMPILRESKTWIPLYILLLIFATFKLKKKVWIWILGAATTILLSDQISSHVFKPLFTRPRPCADIDFSPQVRLLLDHCSSGFSFTSSHACNHFSVALFIITTLSSYLKNWKYLFIAWAAIICYAQVYVGVHYPLDVLCGASLGALIGKLTGSFCYRKIYKPETANYKL
jgi:undecaprenyl-diphosphatase